MNLSASGYTILGLVVRTQGYRSKATGRTRSYREGGTYVYVRVRLPNGAKRDLYLGTPGEARRRGRPRVETPVPVLELDGAPGGGESEWRKAKNGRVAKFARWRRARTAR